MSGAREAPVSEMSPCNLISVLILLLMICPSSAYNNALSNRISVQLRERLSCKDGRRTHFKARISTLSLIDGSEAPRKRKQMPQYVQNILNKESLVQDPLDSVQLVEGMMQSPTPARRRNREVINTEIHVRGLPWTMDRKNLRLLFAKYDPLYARILTDSRNSSRSLGYGFVAFKTTSKANAAIRAFNGTEIEFGGRKTTIHAGFALEKAKQRELASKPSQRDFKSLVAMRKAQLTARDSAKVVMSADDMPRRWKTMSDKVRVCTATARPRRVLAGAAILASPGPAGRPRACLSARRAAIRPNESPATSADLPEQDALRHRRRGQQSRRRRRRRARAARPGRLPAGRQRDRGPHPPACRSLDAQARACCSAKECGARGPRKVKSCVVAQGLPVDDRVGRPILIVDGENAVLCPDSVYQLPGIELLATGGLVARPLVADAPDRSDQLRVLNGDTDVRDFVLDFIGLLHKVSDSGHIRTVDKRRRLLCHRSGALTCEIARSSQKESTCDTSL